VIKIIKPMSKEFTQKYVGQSLAQLLDRTIIEQSLESRSINSIEKHGPEFFDQFSVSDYILYTFANFCKAFCCENVYGIGAEILSDTLRAGSRFTEHFGAFYSHVR